LNDLATNVDEMCGLAIKTLTAADNPDMFYRYRPGRLQGRLFSSALMLLAATTALAEGNDAHIK